MLGERPAVPRISDLGHLYSSSLGKLELDMMGSHQMSERQVLDAILAEAIRDVFDQYVDQFGLDEIADIFAKGVKIEVGDMLPSTHYAERLAARAAGVGKGVRSQRRQRAAVRASCVEFVLAGLYASDRISRSAEPRTDHLRNRVALSPRARGLGRSGCLAAVVPGRAVSLAHPYQGPRT